MSNLTGGDDGSFSSGNTGEEVHQEKQQPSNFKTSSSSVSAVATNSNGSSSTQQQTNKKKRNLPGNPGTSQSTSESLFADNLTQLLIYYVSNLSFG